MFFLTMLCVSFTIAFAFAWHGLWLILPFAGIEMLVLGLALYWCMNSLSRVETITVSDEEISVNVRQRNRELARYTFPRAWTRATTVSPASTIQKQSLWLGGRQSKVEIGVFLDDREKVRLANAINKAIRKEL